MVDTEADRPQLRLSRAAGRPQVVLATEPAGGEVVSCWFPGSILQAAGKP